MLDLEHDLNERQREAVSHVEGPLLVIAGAGSGKTRVITYRVANLVERHGVRPGRILAVTFTNKAAREMKERVDRLLGGAGAAVWVATFHASCARILRTHGEMIGVNPRFTIYDDGDQKAMVTRCLKELELDDRKFPPRAIQHEINWSKQLIRGAADYPASDFYRERVRSVFALYERRMKDAAALDFGDLIFATVRGMRASEAFHRAVAGRFDYVLVDEFQDTNHAQLELVRQLGAPHGNVCVVGDDDQSIYSWRGADVGNILDFEKHFPGAVTVTLDRNYRSTANILKGAHAVVAKLTGRRQKELWTTSPAGDRIALVEAEDEREEARMVAKAVKELGAAGVPLFAQAVFYRVNAQSRVFEEVFRTMSIPHRVVGGMRFYERAEVKDVLAYLRLVLNPEDLAAFLRVVNVPSRGIGKSTIDRLMALAAEKGVSAHAAISRAAETGLGAGAVAKLVAFRDMLEAWRSEADEGPHHLAGRILADTGYLSRLGEEDTAEADARAENVKELVGSIEDFEAEAEDPSLASFLELVALQTDVDAARFEGDQVTLMTVHSAKGLEFDAVHVTGLEEGLFPYRPGSDRLLGGDKEELDEERRLCYVALTRARKRLILSRARLRRIFGQTRMDPPSRFLGDLPPTVLDEATAPRRPAPSPAPLQRAWTTRRAPEAPPRGTWVDRSFDQTAEAVGPRIGQRVRHARFGIGDVVAVLPGPKLKVDVLFPAFGTKRVIVDYLDFD